MRRIQEKVGQTNIVRTSILLDINRDMGMRRIQGKEKLKTKCGFL